MQDKYCGSCYGIDLIQSQYTKVAASGRHHKRGGAAFGRTTPFVVSFVLALNEVNIVAVITILVLHVDDGPKMSFQGRDTTRLGSGVFVIPQLLENNSDDENAAYHTVLDTRGAAFWVRVYGVESKT